ncbi:hypothetical protein [Mesorhizobium sp. M0276]|uniref:hypothetical protein n=1 Tax=Mesorhizobium sp. M0276 TaxID=2956928 RepID=UPI00333AF5C7
MALLHFNSEILKALWFNALQARERVFALHFAGFGRRSNGLFADVLRQGDAGGLEDGPDLAFHVGSGGDALASCRGVILAFVSGRQKVRVFGAVGCLGVPARSSLLISFNRSGH